MLPDCCTFRHIHWESPFLQLFEGCKSELRMFFLPLPLQNTLDRLGEAGFKAEFCSDNTLSVLPDPELYIIVDSRPTKDNVVWQSLVDKNNVRRAVEKLKDTNWLYRNGMKVALTKLLKRQL